MSSAAPEKNRTLVESRWSAPLGRMVAVASLVFAIGTALHNFAVIDRDVIEEMMGRAGEADPSRAAPGFTTGFQLVGSLYIVGNAAGVLAWRHRPAWLYWLALAVNASQGLGWLMIPPEMWSVVEDRYGIVGILPSAVTDAGGALLAILLVVGAVRFRRPWAARGRISDGNGRSQSATQRGV